MGRHLARLSIVALLVALASCAAPVGTGPLVAVPKDGATKCTAVCTEMGLTLDSVVVMASNVGCVCTARKPDAPTDKSGAAATAGMTTVLLQAEQRRASAHR